MEEQLYVPTEEKLHVPPSKSKVLRGVIAIALVLFVGITIMKFFAKMSKRPKKKSHTKVISLRVETQKVKYQTLLLRLKGYGTAEPDQKVDVVPEVSGRVVYTIKPFKIGTFVKKRQLLFRINPSDFSLEYQRLKAQVSSTKKQISIASQAYKVSHRNLSRSKRLVRRRALDQSSYERSLQAVLDRGQRLESLHQALKIAQLSLRRARLNLNRTSIRAPFDARISRGQLTRGSFVSMGRSIATLESVGAVEIPISFPLKDLRKVKNAEGKSISLKEIPNYLKSLPPAQVTANGMLWNGRVSRLGANIDLSTRTLTMYVRVDLKKQKQVGNLLPGTFCNVSIPVRSIKQAIILPRRTLYEKYVYVAKEGKLIRRTVQVANIDSDSVFITGGLISGEDAITTQLTDPIEGTRVFTHTK